MKIQKQFAASILTAALLGASFPAHAQTPNSAGPGTQEWNTPPAGTEQAQQGYRDGMEAAQLDRAARRPIDPKVSHLYVHPPVKGAAREQYRTSFTSGYEAAVKHTQSGAM